MRDALLVFLGSGLGGVMRFGIIKAFASLLPSFSYIAILSCNLIGCFIAGLLFSYLAIRHNPSWMNIFFITGFAGGFTTFSAFSLDIYKLHDQFGLLYTTGYISLSVIGGIISCILGIMTAKIIA